MTTQSWTLEHDPLFREVWRQVEPNTLTSPEHGFALWQAINHVLDTNISGAFVECGVESGGSSMLTALTLLARGVHRDVYLFDEFDGTYDKVTQAVESTGYDRRLFHYVAGDVRDTTRKTQTLHIALLRLKTDSYENTLAVLKNLYPRVSKWAPVIIDDYGLRQGVRKAVDEFLSDPVNSSSKPLLWALDHTGRGFTKPDHPPEVEMQRYDYVPPGMTNPDLLKLFPYAERINPWGVPWPYLRPAVPHIFRCDSRNKRQFQIGNASYEEAVCLHTVASQFAGKRGLEIGTHFGWTSAHLRAAGLEMDFVDPEFADPDRVAAIEEVLNAIPGALPYRLWPLYSPGAIPEVRGASPAPWSFVFIDGDHDGDAPAADARTVLEHCADDAVVMFHDMTSPHVAGGLAVFKQAGWNVRLFNTMQVLGVAWRGNVTIPEHVPDPNVPHLLFYAHLRDFIEAQP